MPAPTRSFDLGRRPKQSPAQRKELTMVSTRKTRALAHACVVSASLPSAVHAFTFGGVDVPPPSQHSASLSSTVILSSSAGADMDAAMPRSSKLSDKQVFLNSLDDPVSTLNPATRDRTALLNKLATSTTSSPSREKPGSWEGFGPVAEGKWRVIYAPHMTTMANLAGGQFQVEYDLNEDGTMESHARYSFPIVGEGYLSVSGTYGSVDDTTCRVDFDEAWVKQLHEDTSDEPYASIDDVPESLAKTIIRRLGRLFFFDGVSVFPVSFLDDDLIVFDFELLGTRITARKM